MHRKTIQFTGEAFGTYSDSLHIKRIKNQGLARIARWLVAGSCGARRYASHYKIGPGARMPREPVAKGLVPRRGDVDHYLFFVGVFFYFFLIKRTCYIRAQQLICLKNQIEQ